LQVRDSVLDGVAKKLLLVEVGVVLDPDRLDLPIDSGLALSGLTRPALGVHLGTPPSQLGKLTLNRVVRVEFVLASQSSVRLTERRQVHAHARGEGLERAHRVLLERLVESVESR